MDQPFPVAAGIALDVICLISMGCAIYCALTLAKIRKKLDIK